MLHIKKEHANDHNPARKTLLNVGRLTAILTEKVLKSTEISVVQNFVSISV